ncbi:MAG: cytochrome P450 [Acidobacteria bacterium]|nr:cytochrome P450 [Acidobacteriota bacterium]
MNAAPAHAPPSAPSLPLVGDAFAMAGDVGAFFTRQYLQLGPVFRVRALHRRFTVLAGPEANLFVTREGSRHLRSREFWMDFDKELGAARSMVSMDGAEHARMRKAQQPGYSRSFIHEHLDDVIAITRREVAEWPLDEPIPGLYALQRIITEQLGTIAAGVSPRDYLDDMIVFVRTLLAARVTRQRPAVLTRTPRFRRARQRVEELYATVRAAHDPDRRSGAGPDLVDELMALHHGDPQFLPETDLMPAVLGPFIAGLDTVGSTCAFMLYALLKHPDLLERMTAEADASFAHGTLTAAAVRRLDVTHRVALETLRMYPIAPAITRTVSNTFEFAGYTIPAGEKVIVATTVPHHLPEYFPEPERFDIERYTPERQEHRQPGVFVPFGAGPHVCLGAGFAEVSIAATMATIVHEVELALDPPDYVLKISPVPTPSPDDRFRIRMKRRRRRAAEATPEMEESPRERPTTAASDGT